MMLPADVILLIFSFLPLSHQCLLLKKTSQARPEQQSRRLINFYVKQVLLARMKRDEWNIILQTPSSYFGLLCNRDMSCKPIAKLTCVAYNSSTEYLRFESKDPYWNFELDQDVEYQSMRIYCSQWFNLFKEDDRSGQIKLMWRHGDQIKQVDDDLCIGYKCTRSVIENKCIYCQPNNRCNKHAFMSTPTAFKKKLLQIHSIRVSLDWLRQGLILS